MDDQTPQISLDPSLFQPQPTQAPQTTAPATPNLATGLTVPLQPVPPVAAPEPLPKATTPVAATMQPLPSAPAADIEDRRSAVQAELERLQQEENSLLNNIKDWLTKVQGAETKQQTLERELFELDRQLSVAPSPKQLAAERNAKLATYTQQLQQAQTKLSEITKLQKIDEKKAFDNYSAGGLDRQGLLDEMESIRKRYDDQLTALQKVATAAQQMIEQIDAPADSKPQPEPEVKPMPAMKPVAEVIKEKEPLKQPLEPMKPVVEETTQAQTVAAPMSTNLLAKLATLSEAKTGLLHHLVIELPATGVTPLIERSSDGTGVIIRQDTNAQQADRCYIADADLLRAGATPEDIIPLTISTLSSQEATGLMPVA